MKALKIILFFILAPLFFGAALLAREAHVGGVGGDKYHSHDKTPYGRLWGYGYIGKLLYILLYPLYLLLIAFLFCTYHLWDGMLE